MTERNGGTTRPHLERLVLPEAPSARERRQDLGRRVALTLHAVAVGARDHGEADAVFLYPLEQLASLVADLVAMDGMFELSVGAGEAGELRVNRQSVVVEAAAQTAVQVVRDALAQRGVVAVAAAGAVTEPDLRALVTVFASTGPRELARRLAARPPTRFTVRLAANPEDEPAPAAPTTLEERLVDCYARAAAFVARHIEQLRTGGELAPASTASRIAMELVELEALAPLRLMRVAGTKGEGEHYWGFHAANVAVLAVAFGRRLGLSRRRRHDLAMAALVHDAGMAALPPSLLEKPDAFDDRERRALAANPLFAARAALREREVHPAALERALATYECHLDLATTDGRPSATVGFLGRVLAICEAFDALTTPRPYRPAYPARRAMALLSTELAFRFDRRLVKAFPFAIEPLLR